MVAIAPSPALPVHGGDSALSSLVRTEHHEFLAVLVHSLDSAEVEIWIALDLYEGRPVLAHDMKRPCLHHVRHSDDACDHHHRNKHRHRKKRVNNAFQLAVLAFESFESFFNGHVLAPSC
jgi:hypothetical protein